MKRGLICVVLLVPAVGRADVTLYDGTLGTTPNQQGWVFLTNPIFGSSATQTPSPTGTTLNTSTSNSDQAGYFSKLGSFSHPLMPTLDRATGYSVAFDVAVLSEAHAANDRAGFSLIVLSQDLKGIELGFWTDRVWAQSDSPLFTQAEFATADTTPMTSYVLSVSGSAYTLSVGSTPLLSGALRDYSAKGFPYDTPSFLFLGDDTASARATIKLAKVGVNAASVPEPAAWRLFALGIGGAGGASLVRRRPLNPFQR